MTITILKLYRDLQTYQIKEFSVTCSGQTPKKTRDQIGSKVSVESVIHLVRTLFRVLQRNLILI